MVVKNFKKADNKSWLHGLIILVIGVIYYYISPVLSGFIVLSSSAFYAISTMIKSKDIFNLKSLFIGSWGVTLGLAMMRLLVYQREWDIKFIIVLLIGIGFFLMGLKASSKNRFIQNIKMRVGNEDNSNYEQILFIIVVIATFVAIVMFIASYSVTGIIPAFSDELTAYLDHYTRFYVIQVGMMPAGGIALWLSNKERGFSKKKIILLLITAIHLVIFPLLYVARGTFVIGMLFTLPIIYDAIENKKVFLWIILIGLISVFLIISISRNYTAEQYHYFFRPRIYHFFNVEFKLPPFLSMIYGYLTVSHDNAALNIGLLESHTLGGFLLEPFNTIMRSDLPELLRARNPLFNISDGLNTHNMIGIIYYDFGLIGVAVIMYIYGVVSGVVENLANESRNPFILLIFGGVIIVTVMGFFTAWTTQFTLWMWWGTVIIFAVVCWYFARKRGEL